MSQNPNALVDYIQESVKLPRENGELVFHQPWEARIFAMAVLLLKKEVYQWKSFNSHFVAEIGEAEREHPEIDVVTTYYDHWVKAFEKILLEKDVLSEEQLNIRTHEFSSGQRHHVC